MTADSLFGFFPTGANTPPDAADDVFAIDEDTPLNGNVPGDNRSGADSDVDEDPLTVNKTPVSDVAHRALAQNGDGSFSYSPDTDLFGSNSFTCEVGDGKGGTDAATVSVTVDPVNNAPILTSPAAVQLVENRRFATTLTAHDVEGDPLSFAITGGADAGLFRIDAATGVLRLADMPDFETPLDAQADNTCEVTVEVADSSAATDVASLTVEATGAVTNDPPLLWNRVRRSPASGTSTSST